MKLRDFFSLNSLLGEDTFVLILDLTVPECKPIGFTVRVARSLYGDREVLWFAGDVICIKEK